jgi:hypothetical protein
LNISQWEGLSLDYGKIKKVPNHQPVSHYPMTILRHITHLNQGHPCRPSEIIPGFRYSMKNTSDLFSELK